MLDHFGLFVPASRFDQVLAWYDAALAPLGYVRKDFVPGQLIGMSVDGYIYDFWIHKKDESERTPVHFAFRAKDHEMVNKFHVEGLKAGGKCNGRPGLRENYHPNYYGAFVLDPCG